VRRRWLLAAAAWLVPLAGHAQSAFVGRWQGEVEGVGKARLVTTAVKPNGQIEGRMEFDLQSYISTFADKADSIKNTNYGMISGTALAIDSALGGTYEPTLSGNPLNGTYARGTTLRGKASFVRA